METRYFVKFVGDTFVTVAKAHSDTEAETLLDNQYEETTEEFFDWVRSNTSELSPSTECGDAVSLCN